MGEARRLVSLRIRPETWVAFQELCAKDGVTASAGVRRLVSLYLQGLVKMPR